MKVTVCLPTFRRAGALVWSLGSVLAQRLEGLSLDAPPRLVVLNNDRDREPVDRAVARALSEVGARGWELRVVHRDPPMDPALNWYGGIREHAPEGAVTFLHGDDDLVVRDGLRAWVAEDEASHAEAPGAGERLEPQALAALLQALERKLRDLDPEAADLAQALARHAGPRDEMAARLSQQTQDFEFDGALETLQNLTKTWR